MIRTVGAARAAGMGIGFYADSKEAFASLEKIAVIEPEHENENNIRSLFKMETSS
jgi:xylulokinase